MLGAYFRIICYNNSATSSNATPATTTAKIKGWYISSSGVPTWGSETTVFSNSAAITTGSYETAAATAQNNAGAANPLIGAEIELVYTATGTPTGTVTFFLQNSDDGGTTWPDNGNGEVLWTLAPTTAAAYTNVVKYPG